MSFHEVATKLQQQNNNVTIERYSVLKWLQLQKCLCLALTLKGNHGKYNRRIDAHVRLLFRFFT